MGLNYTQGQTQDIHKTILDNHPNAVLSLVLSPTSIDIQAHPLTTTICTAPVNINEPDELTKVMKKKFFSHLTIIE
jgi:hypothetical protein